ncbi:endoplasmic oxidoreductin [Suhomyces tanzawaensis NRRL Y-17324]|uniref:Endoplasmic oxidoreductin n=1 Tax=Suhomyces tanzawaensis NRRL Y-17324 TaxID=984487 RepID=A0A1E4SBV3_9ASCO|nr:endoplasmic oxidoreductin [Suhomyces tanzawaensis NRRL Y-17324]ODV76872.1 endoplasmic oxidoreductin [Suhomyces tanzawaensis NRRL Y-17324]
MTNGDAHHTMKLSQLYVWLSLHVVLAVASSGISKFTPFDSPEYCSQIITPTCNTTFSYIDDLNDHIRVSLSKLVQTSYFRYFKLNFEKQCKFWNAQHFCATENCAVEILSPSQYNWSNVTNDDLRPLKLGKINLEQPATDDDDAQDTDATCEDLDYTHIDDDHQCVYVDLLNNPERFTGYGGAQAFNVWKAIYSENCFPNSASEENHHLTVSDADEDDTCVEKNLFYRVVSGLHASIAVHLSNEYLDSETGEFYPNLKVFMERVGRFNDRLSNIYFNYALVSQALVKLNNLVSLHELIEFDESHTHNEARHKFVNNEEPTENYDELLGQIIPMISSNTLFDTSSLFNPESVSPGLKDEFRSRFKNISAIMDCVGCDRCRMWGKLQTIGYGTALKILFEGEDPKNTEKLRFRRIEIVALFNTFDRLSKSIEAINSFKTMYLQHLEDVRKGIAKPGEYDRKNESNGLAFPFFKVPETASKPEVAAPKKASPKKISPSKIDKSPLGIAKAKKASDRTFVEELRLAIDDVAQATRFVLWSYKTLPSTLWKISLMYLNQGWNLLIGTPHSYKYHSELLMNKNQDDINYENLFSDS